MGKHKPNRKPPNHDRGTIEERSENHQQLFRRLASVIQMHGKPGPRKPKKT